MVDEGKICKADQQQVHYHQISESHSPGFRRANDFVSVYVRDPQTPLVRCMTLRRRFLAQLEWEERLHA